MEPTGRFAPSPSGPLHIGNLRTALLAWLFARSASAGFLVRIEDLDRQRSRPEHERGQLDDLSALGLDWDGEPIRQSERTDRYRTALLRLERAGATYPCWCTRAEVRAAADAPHGPLPEGAYPGTCRRLSAAQRSERARAAGRAPSIRLDAAAAAVALAGSAAVDATSSAAPVLEPVGDGAHTSDTSAAWPRHPVSAPIAPPAISFTDRLHGRTTGGVDDFVLWRWDDTPAYNLAVVVDDGAQGMGEIVRGDDLLDSTPRQILLQHLLGLPSPAYAHVPLVLGPDGARLAKRHRAVTLADRAALGEAPGDALAWMAASLGLAAPGEHPAAADLLERFDPSALPRDPALYSG